MPLQRIFASCFYILDLNMVCVVTLWPVLQGNRVRLNHIHAKYAKYRRRSENTQTQNSEAEISYSMKLSHRRKTQISKNLQGHAQPYNSAAYRYQTL